MAPSQFRLVVDGWAAARRDDMQRRAWEMSLIVQVVTGQHFSPAQLLGEGKREVTVEELRTEMAARKRREDGDV